MQTEFPTMRLPAVRLSAGSAALCAQQAADAADRRDPRWTERAYRAFLAYMGLFPGRPFTTEDVRLAASEVPEPPDTRAWGAIALRLKREGRIRSDGYVISQNPVCHGRPISRWLECR